MRFLSVLLLFASLVPAAVSAPLKIVRVWPNYRTAESFERISEYFGRKEGAGREVVLRTQSDASAGFYFLVRLANPQEALSPVTFELHVIAPSSPQPVRHTFNTVLPSGSRAFHLGLTGSDWPNAAAQPVAWLLVVRGPDGAELARDQSFLWAQPTAGSAK